MLCSALDGFPKWRSVPKKYLPGCNPTRRPRMGACTSSFRARLEKWKSQVMFPRAPSLMLLKSYAAFPAVAGFGENRKGMSHAGNRRAVHSAHSRVCRRPQCHQSTAKHRWKAEEINSRADAETAEIAP